MYLSLLGPKFLKKRWLLRDVDHHLVGLGDHLESVVVADRDALGAALALARVDDDLKHAARHSLLLAAVEILLGPGPLRGTSRGRRGRRWSGASLPSSGSERTLPRIAVSGHSVTQSMQPVQFSVM